jgi:Prenyltransferase and squalene oxidase repeat
VTRAFMPMESLPPAPGNPKDVESSPGIDFLERTCIPYLCHAQNEDGGWGFQLGSRSRVESTAWTLLALRECASILAKDNGEARGVHFLELSQLPDGSWPSSPESNEGCWVTSLACWALLGREHMAGIVARGMNWLCNDRPGDDSLWWRLLRRLYSNRQVSSQNNRYYGWSWTPKTASWVEPTSFALLVLRSSPASLLPAGVLRRQQVAEAMLYDRMCPGGGWNCGNPVIYGVPGEPQISSTVWALLALRKHAERRENQKSLDWLEANWGRSQTPASLALAHIALGAYGRLDASVGESLRAAYSRDGVLWRVPEVAWTALALSGNQSWLAPVPSGKSS